MRMRVALILALLTPLAAEGQELVTLDRGAAYELTWNEKNEALAARVYVTRAVNVKGAIEITLRSIADGRRTDPALTGRFQISHSVLDETDTSFDVTAPKGGIRAGTYEATLTFASKEFRQNANVQLIVPAATLAAPASLQLTRTVSLRGRAFDDPTVALVLLETSGKSPADVKVQLAEPLSNADGQYGFGLAIAPGTVNKGAMTELQPRVSGDLPLGVVSSKLTISSDQLAAPLTIPVQVRTRLTRVALAVIIVLGLALGFAMRIALKGRIEIGEARQRAFAAMDKLRDRIPDTIYQQKLDAARTPLASAIKSTTATTSTIATAITDASAAQQVAVADLKDRVNKAETARDKLAAAVTPAWTLPAAMAAAVAAATQRVRAASSRLQLLDAAGAATIVEEATTMLISAIRPAAAAWQAAANGLLDGLTAIEPMVDSSARVEYAVRIKAVADQVAAATLPANADAAGVKTALEAVNNAMERFPTLVTKAADEVQRSFERMNVIIGAIDLPEGDLWTEVGERTQQFGQALRRISLEPSVTWTNLENNARMMRQLWRDTLGKQANDPNPVWALFDTGNFEQAARTLESQYEVRQAGTTLGATSQAAPVAARTEPAPEQFGALEAVPQASAPVVLDAELLTAFRARSRAELALDNALQWIASAVALTFVGYLIFADKFIGTSGDLMTAFFWGFTTDIGVDALVTAAKSKPSP